MSAAATELPLAPLRDDLRLAEAAPGADGAPAWVIQDPVLNRFFRIGWLEFECLLRWSQAPRRICESIAAQTALRPDVAQVLELGRFLERHQLLRPDAAAIARLRQRHAEDRWLSWRWWLHHYLFFRVPLVRPQAFLRRLEAATRWLFTPAAAIVVASLGLLGVALVLRQWDTFLAAVADSFTLQGLAGFAVALVAAKTLHELAHALVATRLGLRVANMGVAFVVLWPMLYTDTGESWKLSRSRERLAISSAGVLCELALAGLATLGWVLSEPGALRDALLYLAAVSWLLSLALNANPFMRFDGYFILSDLLDLPNLHERSSALARVALRRGVLGLAEEWPEALPALARRLMVAFALVTWLYRFALFVGIAVAVYLFFFKLLGIFLFAVELAWFIGLPVWREALHWWSSRGGVSRGRRLALWSLLGTFLLLLAVPWRSQVEAFGVARSEHQLRVFAPFAARLQQVRAPGKVGAGETLAVLEEPDIDARLRRSEAGMRSYESQLAGLLADATGLDRDAATRQRLTVETQESRSARSEIARLNLQAPFAGEWRDVDPDLRPGQWVGNRKQLGVLIEPGKWQADAYVEPDDVRRLRPDARVRFYAEGEPAPIGGRVLAISSTRAKQLAHPMLAAKFSGPLATARDGDALAPNPPRFHVLVQLDAPPPALRETRGRLQIEGERRSWLGEALMRASAVLIRESGF